MCRRLNNMEGITKKNIKGFLQDVPQQLEKPKRKRSVLDNDDSMFNKILNAAMLDYERNM